jgi:hypothetical protein
MMARGRPDDAIVEDAPRYPTRSRRETRLQPDALLFGNRGRGQWTHRVPHRQRRKGAANATGTLPTAVPLAAFSSTAKAASPMKAAFSAGTRSAVRVVPSGHQAASSERPARARNPWFTSRMSWHWRLSQIWTADSVTVTLSKLKRNAHPGRCGATGGIGARRRTFLGPPRDPSLARSAAANLWQLAQKLSTHASDECRIEVPSASGYAPRARSPIRSRAGR